MTPPESARVIAMARLNERARRISRMRRSVIAAGVSTFILAWGLALNDQLAHGTKTSSESSGGSGQTSASTSTDDEGSVESDDGLVVVPSTPAPSTSVQVAPTPTPAPVTTSQS